MNKSCRICRVEFHVKPSHFLFRETCSRACRSEWFKKCLRGRDNPNWKGGKVQLHCKRCRKQYSVIPSKAKTSKYCSRLCLNRVNSRVPKKRFKNPSTVIKKLIHTVHASYWKLTHQPHHCKICGKKINKGRTYCIVHTPREKREIVGCIVCGATMILRLSQVDKKKTCSGSCAKRYARIRQLGAKSHRYIDGRCGLKRKLRNLPEMKTWKTTIFVRDNWKCRHCGIGGHLNAHHIERFARIVQKYDLKSLWDALYCEFLWDTDNGIALCSRCHKRIHGVIPWQEQFHDQMLTVLHVEELEKDLEGLV